MNIDSAHKEKIFWLIYIALMILVASVSFKFLMREIFNMSLWESFVEDPDHRHKPYERDDINGDGIRSEREADDFKRDDFNIIFSGDSYTYGYQLKAKQSPPRQFESMVQQQFPEKNVKVANFGWSSSSPYLSLRLLKDKAKKYKPDLVIFILDVTDYKDDFFYRNIIEKREGYKILVEHPLLTHFPRKIAQKTDPITHWHQKWLGYPHHGNYFLFHQPYEQSVAFFDNTYNILLEMNDYVRNELHARFIVFIPPRHWQYTDKESPLSWERHNYDAMSEHVLNNFIYFEDKAKTAPFPIISLLDDFKNTKVFPTTFEKDSHWNPKGARFAAETILKHCKKLNCLD